MAAVAASADSPDQAISLAVKTLHAADIYALQHRLSRCIQTVYPLLPSAASEVRALSTNPATSPSTARHVRRLSELLREAKELNARLTEQDCCKESSPTFSPQCENETTVDESLRSFYDQQLQVRFAQMRRDMVVAEHLLRAYLTATPALRGLPVNCVGTTPRPMKMPGGDAATELCYVYTDALTSSAARLPSPILHHIEGDAAESRSFTTASSSPPQRQPTPQHSAEEVRRDALTPANTSAPALAASPSSISVEDRIMEDIQHAIHQMKDGALQMSAMMAQEKTQMKSAAELLSGGVVKSQANMADLDRVSYLASAAKVPWIVSFIPGMSMLWRTVLQPMWALLKQVLLMASILAITGCMLLLISVLPKPVVFRSQQKPLPVTHTSSPRTAGGEANVPASSPTPAPSTHDHSIPSAATVLLSSNASSHASVEVEQDAAEATMFSSDVEALQAAESELTAVDEDL